MNATSTISGNSKTPYQIKDKLGLNYENNESALDLEFIYNITEELSNIIFTEYNEGEGDIAKGRFFGTIGEHVAARILKENMTKIGLYTRMEQIINNNSEESCENLTGIWEVEDYYLKINNETVPCHITPSKFGARGNPGQSEYEFHFTNLKIKRRPKTFFPWGEIRKDIAEKNNYLYIDECNAFNPDREDPPIEQFLKKFISPFSYIFMNSLDRRVQMAGWHFLLKKCQGLLFYDFNNDTYNMGSHSDPLPVIFINGTIGRKLWENPENYRVEYYLKRRYNDSVTSYNVIGQINGTTEPNKIVIVDCLYDSWWCQGTVDAAIGMAMVLGIAKYFMDNGLEPKYTIKFIGFGGEEVGLRGAYSYEIEHRDEEILYVIDLNQLGFWQENSTLTLNVIANKLPFIFEIWPIVKKINYEQRVNDSLVKMLWMPFGAPSDQGPFVRQQRVRPNLKSVCFLKDSGWKLHHRDGLNHAEGDVMKYYDTEDVAVTTEMILNITKYLTL